MNRLYKYPLLQTGAMALAMVGIFGVTSWLLQLIQPPAGGLSARASHQQNTNERLLVQAAGKCPYSAPVSLGPTAGGSEMRTNPAKDPKVYDVFNTVNYLLQSDGRKMIGTAITQPEPDPKLPVIGTTFGFKPSSAVLYRVLETNNTPVSAPWLQYALGIPTNVGDPIRAPQTGYDIGGGKMGLVKFAAADRLTIHIGRSEYLTGTPGTAESGGYWIYVSGLCVNQQIVSQYNANATTRKQLPELAAGELLGYAIGSEVLIAVRDNGPFQDILSNEWWGGVPIRTVDTNLPADQPPVAVQPPAQQPTAQPQQPAPQPQQPVVTPLVLDYETTLDSQSTNAFSSDITSDDCRPNVHLKNDQQPIAQSPSIACTDNDEIVSASLSNQDSSVRDNAQWRSVQRVILDAIAPQGVIITWTNDLTTQEHNDLVDKTVRVSVTMRQEGSCGSVSTSPYCLHLKYLGEVNRAGMYVILMEANGSHLILSGRNITNSLDGGRFTISFDYTYPSNRQLRRLEPVGITGPFVIAYL